MSKAIYKKDLLYTVLRPYVDYCARSVYSKVIIRGENNIPKDGAVILAPNHCNALMDALVILRAFPDQTVFGARADIFRKPTLAKILRFLKILPMVRQRDGLHNVIKNKETTEEIIEVLDNGVRFCMFNEGKHRAKRSLLPIGKGIFRIAITAAERFGDSKPVYVVPVGLEYGDYFRYKATCTVTYGKPINVSAFLKENTGSGEAEIYRGLRETLGERLSSLITYIKDDEDYEAKWILTKAASSGKPLDQEDLLAYNKATIADLEALAENEPDKAAEMFRKAEDFEKERLAKKVSFLSLGQDNSDRRLLFKTLTAIIGFLYFLWCMVMAFPMWATAEYLCHYKIKDKAFRNTARCGVKLAMSPIMIAIWAVWFFCTLPWQFATLLLLFNLASYSKFYEYKKFIRILMSDFRLMKDRKLQEKIPENDRIMGTRLNIKTILAASAVLLISLSVYAETGEAVGMAARKDTTEVKKKKTKKAVTYNEKGEIIKTGLNFGPLPVVAFDNDKGFQFGALLNIFNFGDGSTYPEPKSQWYIEASAYVKQSKIGTQKYVVSYDNKHLTDNYNLRLCAAASLFEDTALEFFGFNGYESFYDASMPTGFYRHSRTTGNLKVDLIGEIAKNFYWEAGYHFNWFNLGQYKDFYKNTLADSPAPQALFDLYRAWGIIPEDQLGSQFSSALRFGLMYDSRNYEASPSKGIWAEAHLVTAPKFLGSSHAYNKFNVTFRHYVPIYKDKVVFAYRLNYQGFLGKNTPWYTIPYLTVVGPLYDRDGLGGYRTVRGILYNRVQGLHTAFFNAEIRYRFIDFKLWNQNIAFAVSGFCDGAGVIKGMDMTNRTGYAPELYAKYIPGTKENIHIAAGGGLRFIMNRNFIVAFEYAQAINRQDNAKGAFYINTGFLF